ncbi:TIGR03032 family protein [Nocardioides houyundeii]|uniref:TIGR03032 family protein n=1 Tax=Nocardioides houyundeii TaxID=2045452 RepID=UPI001F077675|nr:TIGR03032 family protein [Nocardioides houyundeii]
MVNRGRPVLLLGSGAAALDTLAQSLLAAPGTWDATVTPLKELADAPPPADVPAGVPARAVTTVGPGDLDALPDGLPDEADYVLLHHTPHGLDDAELAAWAAATTAALDLLERLPTGAWLVVDQDDLLAEPENGVQRLFDHLGLGWHSRCSWPWHELAARTSVGTPAAAAGAVPEAAAAPLVERVRRHLATVDPSLAPTTTPGSLSAVDHGLGRVLRSLGCSLAVSTYQSNRLVVLRDDGGRLGVHLRAFDRPMGIATTPDGLALGVRSEVLDFRDFPAAAQNLEPQGKHDACFLPRNSHVTGDIAVHDLAMGRDGLWLVATSFSCLATLDAAHSFVPRWQPPFVTALAPQDRCHLNGLALVDGVPRYVTALGVSDSAGGWRAEKATGGVLLEVPSGRVVLEGLSMPHSPRWHDGRLYVLESGRGRLLECDPATGTTRVVAELPGFTRGLSFVGQVAFVGTSQVRETATFGGLPISALPRRECGVWAIDLRSGEVVGSVRFEDRIQEVFDVAALPGIRFPEIGEPGSDLVRTSWFVPAPG